MPNQERTAKNRPITIASHLVCLCAVFSLTLHGIDVIVAIAAVDVQLMLTLVVPVYLKILAVIRYCCAFS